jgi:hypothetical protein
LGGKELLDLEPGKTRKGHNGAMTDGVRNLGSGWSLMTNNNRAKNQAPWRKETMEPGSLEIFKMRQELRNQGATIAGAREP